MVVVACLAQSERCAECVAMRLDVARFAPADVLMWYPGFVRMAGFNLWQSDCGVGASTCDVESEIGAWRDRYEFRMMPLSSFADLMPSFMSRSAAGRLSRWHDHCQAVLASAGVAPTVIVVRIRDVRTGNLLVRIMDDEGATQRIFVGQLADGWPKSSRASTTVGADHRIGLDAAAHGG